jgi:hypothetical protein
MAIKSIKIQLSEWTEIQKTLREEYGNLALLNSWRKRTLGFTERSLQYFDSSTRRYHSVLYLDFYDEVMKTFFVLKYLNNRPEELT